MFKNLRWFPGFLKRYVNKLKYITSLRRHKTIGILNYFSYLLILMIRVILPGLPRSLWTEIPGKAWLTPSYDPPIRSPRLCGKENYRESYTPHKVKTYWTFFLFKEKKSRSAVDSYLVQSAFMKMTQNFLESNSLWSFLDYDVLVIFLKFLMVCEYFGRVRKLLGRTPRCSP